MDSYGRRTRKKHGLEKLLTMLARAAQQSSRCYRRFSVGRVVNGHSHAQDRQTHTVEHKFEITLCRLSLCTSRKCLPILLAQESIEGIISQLFYLLIPCRSLSLDRHHPLQARLFSIL